MDVDAFVASHRSEWEQLDRLAHRHRLTATEADELVLLYRRCATHLSTLRSRSPDPATLARLSGLLARARAAVLAEPGRSAWAGVVNGVLVLFPLVVYRAWRWWLSLMLGSYAIVAAMISYLRAHPGHLHAVLSDADIRKLVDHDFSSYYRADPAQEFALHVWLNNALIAALTLVLGITLIGTVYVLLQNVLNLAVVAAAMITAGKTSLFFGLIIPHGLLELTAVFVAAGVGLQTGWAWVAPGRQPRSQALAQAARTSITVAVGLIVVLAVSGVIEAFVTPSGWPTPLRIGIGVVAELGFLSYVTILGRRATAAGINADLQLGDRDDVAPVA